jgi:hypothetical protein
MTVRQFDAPASITRPPSRTRDRGRGSLARIAWLLARFIRREAVHYEVYEAHFGGSVRAFRRDLAALRSARIYRGGTLLGSDVS